MQENVDDIIERHSFSKDKNKQIALGVLLAIFTWKFCLILLFCCVNLVTIFISEGSGLNSVTLQVC